MQEQKIKPPPTKVLASVAIALAFALLAQITSYRENYAIGKSQWSHGANQTLSGDNIDAPGFGVLELLVIIMSAYLSFKFSKYFHEQSLDPTSSIQSCLPSCGDEDESTGTDYCSKEYICEKGNQLISALPYLTSLALLVVYTLMATHWRDRLYFNPAQDNGRFDCQNNPPDCTNLPLIESVSQLVTLLRGISITVTNTVVVLLIPAMIWKSKPKPYTDMKVVANYTYNT